MAFKQAVGKLKEAMAADQAQDFTAAAAHYAAGLALLTEAADAPGVRANGLRVRGSSSHSESVGVAGEAGCGRGHR